jgi:AcrR family transcriptional regulator
MVRKLAEAAKKPRGRPRAYNAETALRHARDVFWRRGYVGASLDEISAAAGMNRPSLRAAFGDKHALYLKTLNAYWDLKAIRMGEALSGPGLEVALMRAYDGALATYFSGQGRARGCFVVTTAITEAVEDAEIRRVVTAGFKMLDDSFERLFRSARDNGERPRRGSSRRPKGVCDQSGERDLWRALNRSPPERFTRSGRAKPPPIS